MDNPGEGAQPRSIDAIVDSVMGKADGNTPPPATVDSASAEQPTGQPDAAAATPITVKTEQPDQAQTPTGKEGAQWRPAEGVKPDTVIGYDGDKPVTFAEAQAASLRQADYTRKTQELATEKGEVAAVRQFIDDNRSTLEAFDSGDPARIVNAIGQIAEMYGVGHLLGSGAQGAGPVRGPDGRFQPASPQAGPAKPGRVDLSEFEEGDAAHTLGGIVNSLLDKAEAADTRWDQLVNGLSSQVQEEQNQAAMDKQAAEWKAAGLTQVDAKGASALIGKPITAEQAMWLHHLSEILDHNAGAASKAAGRPKPNEPGGTDHASRPSAKGKSITQYIDEIMPGE